ncbi:VTT domain-containing protein [Patescibacteria group bacterium]|nr:VTT domain-containing protein [Patescibacteria group bacterium]MBU1683351.1 VTT domain-containing protein [Patescibacteria group bacterium]MBU1935551.1 VTT domain-containing protein [Patescibacteria group bacterium]
MNNLIELAKEIIATHGYAGIFALTTAEQFIFPVPADIFITLGTSTGLIFTKVLWIISIAAVVGSLIGYFLGRFIGHPIIKWMFGQERLNQCEEIVKKWGMWGVIIAGLTPIPFKIFTWTAGAFEMPLGRYLFAVTVSRIPRYIFSAYAGVLIFKTKFYASTEMSALILGTFQGITEFVPISSSGHLVIIEHFLHLPEEITAQTLATFDIFLHGGSLLAIVIYFWKDWVQVIKDAWKMVSKFKFDYNSLAFKLALGTIPAIIAGLTLGDYFTGPLRNLNSIAIAFIVLAVVYFYVAWKGQGNRKENVSLKNSVIIGCAQALALIPGVSRAGSTIAAGVLSGLKREAAAKFSFMLGGIAILAANVYALMSIGSNTVVPGIKFTLLGFGASFVFSFLAITFLIKYLQKHTMRAFGIYLLLVGILILSFM